MVSVGFAQVFETFDSLFRRFSPIIGGHDGISARRADTWPFWLVERDILGWSGGWGGQRSGVLGRAAHPLTNSGLAGGILGREFGVGAGGRGCLDGAF